MPLEQTATTFSIDAASLGVVWWLWRRDVKARDRQIARIGREESLSECRVQLSNGKTVPLSRLRSFCRPVLFYGTPEQVEKARSEAEPLKEELLRRGVFIVLLPFADPSSPPPTPPQHNSSGDKEERWEGTAVQSRKWRSWFEDQAKTANKATDRGLYVGLRLDGRVRASGSGSPPWAIFAKQLAPMEGKWGGFLDGMDGTVGGN